METHPYPWARLVIPTRKPLTVLCVDARAAWLAHQSAPVRRLQVGEAVRVLALQEWARPPPAVQLGTSGCVYN